MGPLPVVQVDVLSDEAPGMTDRLVRFQVDLLVLDAAPDPLNEPVVAPASLAVHRQPHAAAQHGLGERARRELATLIGVHYVRRSVAGERHFQRLDGVRGFQRDGDPMRENLAIGPVHHRRQIHEAARHRNVRRIEGEHLIGVLDLHAAQQVRPDLVLCVATARVRLAVQRLHAHAFHQRAHATATHFMAFPAQQARRHPCPGKRKLRVQFVHATHQQLIDFAHRPWRENTRSISRCRRASLAFDTGNA